MLDTAAFSDLRSYIKRRVIYARYRIGSTYYQTPLNEVTLLSSGTVRVQLSILQAENVTINRVELWNSNGDLWAHQDCSITIESGQTGILYWFDINIEETQ